jgi:hypothetical protein
MSPAFRPSGESDRCPDLTADEYSLISLYAGFLYQRSQVGRRIAMRGEDGDVKAKVTSSVGGGACQEGTQQREGFEGMSDAWISLPTRLTAGKEEEEENKAGVSMTGRHMALIYDLGGKGRSRPICMSACRCTILLFQREIPCLCAGGPILN